MALQEDVGLVSLPASGDLSTKQYFAVKLDSNGRVAVAGAGEAAIGILQTKPDTLGDICSVAVFKGQKLKAFAGNTITAGGAVTADASGELVPATTGDYIYGYALGAAVDGDVFQFLAVTHGVVPA